MNRQQFWRVERAAGLFLVLGFVTNIAGVVMFSIRDGTSGNPPPSFAYYAWERGFVMAAVVVTTIGFVLLAEHFHVGDGRVLARTGATIYLFAGILGVVAEALDISQRGQHFYPLIVVHVVLAFLAQAAMGGALWRSRLLAPWIGSVTVVWNLAWLVVLPAITPGDIYFPILHDLMPLLIGAALLWRARLSQTSAQRIGQQETSVLR